ncbi:MAG TPA: glycosyltransferase family 39 protein [Phototrophicaceae bacterium]|nr:glycosyltransferase family 39 protein [Phototrophicaceae bacterium]
MILIAILVVITVIALPILTYPLGRDQGEFATIGRGILEGKIPYVDLWNPKPPAVFYVYALAMTIFGRTSAGLRAIDLIIFPPTAAAIYWIGRRIANVRIGLWAALLFGVFYFTETFWTLTQNDGIVLLPMTLALICAIKAADADKRAALWAFASGALCAYILWFKYPFVIFIGAAVFTYIFVGARRAVPLRRRDVLAFIAGGCVIGLGGIICLIVTGAWAAFFQSAVVTASYTAQGIGDVVSAMQTALAFRWDQWGLLFVLAVIGLLFAIRRINRRSLWWIVLVWLIAGTAIMLIQLKFYDYHWLPMLPPLALIGAAGIEAVIEVVRNRGGARRAVPLQTAIRGIIALALLVAMTGVIWSLALPYLTGREDQVAYYHHFQAGEFVADESLEVADFLRQRVAPGDSLFIWGFRPEVYYLSQLNPAVRFIFQFPLVANWYPQEWKKETVDILWAALPPYVLVLQADYMPWVTGNDQDSNTDLQQYTELNNWLEYNYVRDTQIGNFFIWRRISTPK